MCKKCHGKLESATSSQSTGIHTLLVILVMLIIASPLRASVLTWTGSGINGNWNNSVNWNGAGTPTNGDTLVFPAGAFRPANTNDISNLTVANIRFTGAGGGYTIYGNQFTLTNAIEATNTTAANYIYNNIAFTATNTLVDVASGMTLYLNGNLNGSGGLVKAGAGILSFSGSPANTYSGTTWVNAGTLMLNRNGVNNALGGPLVIGAALVQLNQSVELPTGMPITINDGGTLDLNNHNDYLFTSLTLAGNGSVTTGAGIFYVQPNAIITSLPGFFESTGLSGNLNLMGACTFSTAASLGALYVSAAVGGTGPINVISNGYTTLAGSNSFTGQLNILGNSTLAVNNAYALGTTNGAVTISNSAALNIAGSFTVLNKSLTDASTTTNGSFNLTPAGVNATWNGPIVLAAPVTVSVATNSYFYWQGAVGGPGGFTTVGPGAVVLYAAGKNFTGPVTNSPGSTLYLFTSAVAVPGNLVVGGTVYQIGDTQLGLLSGLTILHSGVYHVGNNIGSCDTLNGSGTLDLGTMAMTVGYSGLQCQFDGVITNTGKLNVNSCTLTLTGNNSYTGTTEIEGTLFVNGYQPQSPVLLDMFGLLRGTGRVGDILASDSTIEPGNPVGVLTSGNVALDNGAALNTFLFGSTPLTSYSQLNTAYATNVDVTGGTLNVYPFFNADDGPTNGQQYVIINNPTPYPIVGTFNGLPSGTIFTAWYGMQFRIGYNEGGNHNVVLTYTNPPSQSVVMTVKSGAGDGSLNPNGCNGISLTLRNPGGVAMTNVSAVLKSLTPGAVVSQPFSTYPNIPAGGSATNLTPFQILTYYYLPCSGPITFEATFQTANLGTFSVPFTFQSGTPLQFDNLTPLSIPDLTTVTSSIPVSGLLAPITKVEVLMNLTHSYDADLVVDLIAPDGTLVNLINHNGMNGQNFGSACGSDFTETIFDDSASASIASGTAPFLGNYRPMSGLFAYVGKSGTNVNNAKWHLRVADTDAGNSGTLQCWSLRIWPDNCVDGGGGCQLCPNTVLYGALGPSSPTQSDRLTRNGTPTTCAAPTSCPGGFGGELDYYDSYIFRNGPSDACITVTLTAPNADLFSAAYTNTFNPSIVCSNYLADCGDSTLNNAAPGYRTYSFSAPANGVFIVTVNGIGGGYGPYSLSVSGGSCQPMLSIKPAGNNQVKLAWPTSAGGYLLEGANHVGNPSPIWQTVTNPPVVISGQYVVTNGVGSNEFYRLRKPLH